MPPQLSLTVKLAKLTVAGQGSPGLSEIVMSVHEITGGVVSSFQVYDTSWEALLPQASVAEYVNFWLRLQPSLITAPGVQTTCTFGSHASLAVTRLEQLGGVGLQPRSPPAGRFASAGGVVSSVHVYVIVA